MANKTSYDPQIVKDVRSKALEEIHAILIEDPRSKKFSKLKRDMLMKLANTVLPRVTELSGPDGAPIPISNVQEDCGIPQNSEAPKEN